MPIPRAALWIAAALVAGCTANEVVTTPAPAPAGGTAVRYTTTAAPADFRQARLVSLDSASLVTERFVGDRDRWVRDTVATTEVESLQLRIDRHSNAVRGMVFGGVVGLALGVLCAAGSDESDEWLSLTPSPGDCLALGAGSGVLYGLVIGAGSHTNVWAPVALPAAAPPTPARPPVARGANGIRIGLRLPLRVGGQ